MYIKQLTKWWLASAFALFLTSGCTTHKLVIDDIENHTLTIDDMGNVWASGKNNHGQLGLALPANQSVTRPIQIPSLQNIVRVYTNGNSSYAIDGEGFMYSWGQNDKCQLGNGHRTDQFSPDTILTTGMNPAENIWKTESSGTSHKLEIRKDGSLWASGNNQKGQLGQGNTHTYNTPVVVLPDIKFKSVYALNDGSRAISKNGELYVWGDSLYKYMGYDVAYPKPLLTPTHLNGVGKIQIIDIWNQKQTVPHTSFLPLNEKRAIITFMPSVDGGMATRADGTTLVWGDTSGSCIPKQDISLDANTVEFKKSIIPPRAKDRITLQITNVAPYTGEPITLQARVAHNAMRDVRFIVNGLDLAKCKVPVFGETHAKQNCVFNDYINMAGLIIESEKPNTLKGLDDSFQHTVALTRYKAPSDEGNVTVRACATVRADSKEVCSPVREIRVRKLVCKKTDYDWALYQPGKWALSAKQINDIFRLDTAKITSAWGPANTVESTDSNLTQGMVNFLGRNIKTMLNSIDLSEKNIIMAVDSQTGYDWLPADQTIHWNPIHKAWITTKKMHDGKQCVTHVSRDTNTNFRTDRRGSESVFTDGFKVPSLLKDDPGAETITTSQIYHVVVAGCRSRTSYISTSGNFKWTYWVAGHDLGRKSEQPYSLYSAYTWNGLVSKVHTTRGDQAEISVPYSMAGHNILGAYKLNRPETGPFSFRKFTLNKNFYPQTIDYME